MRTGPSPDSRVLIAGRDPDLNGALSDLLVASQLPAERFYASHGFTRQGEMFLDQGVPHVMMKKTLSSR